MRVKNRLSLFLITIEKWVLFTGWDFRCKFVDDLFFIYFYTWLTSDYGVISTRQLNGLRPSKGEGYPPPNRPMNLRRMSYDVNLDVDATVVRFFSFRGMFSGGRRVSASAAPYNPQVGTTIHRCPHDATPRSAHDRLLCPYYCRPEV